MRTLLTGIILLFFSLPAYGQQQAGTGQLVDDILREVVDQAIYDAKEEVRRSIGVYPERRDNGNSRDEEYMGRDKGQGKDKNKEKGQKKSDEIDRELAQIDKEHERKLKKYEDELAKKLEKSRSEFKREASKEEKPEKVAEKRSKLEQKVDNAYSKFDKKVKSENQRYEEKRNKILSKM